jgi:hypothetical protein
VVAAGLRVSRLAFLWQHSATGLLLAATLGGSCMALVCLPFQSNTRKIPEQYQCKTFVKCCSAATSKMQQNGTGIDTILLKTAHLITWVIICHFAIWQHF